MGWKRLLPLSTRLSLEAAFNAWKIQNENMLYYIGDSVADPGCLYRIPDPHKRNLSILSKKKKKKFAVRNMIRAVHPGSGP